MKIDPAGSLGSILRAPGAETGSNIYFLIPPPSLLSPLGVGVGAYYKEINI